MSKKIFKKALLLAFIGGCLIGCAEKSQYRQPSFTSDLKAPTLLEAPELIYPQEAKEKGWQGDVSLYLYINENGNVTQTRIRKSSGHQTLDKAALTYAQHLKFESPKTNDNPTSVWMTWIVTFKLETQVTTATTDYLSESTEARNQRMQWWREARFGMFIHWGLYAILAGEYKGQTVTGNAEWIQAKLNIPRDEYAQLAKGFNPVKFDANEWVQLAKNAGMKYIVITSKHHDGFTLWDSKVTEFDVVDATPFGKDMLAELRKECEKQEMKLGFYYSILDWHHPSQYVDPKATEPRQGHAKNKIYPAQKDDYLNYMKTQLTELVERYTPAVLWFDGEWTEWWLEADGKVLYNYLRSLKSDLIINNRIGKGRQGMQGLNKGPGYTGDFGTPEQEIPATGLPGIDWESCMTMNDSWGYKHFDHNWKSAKTLVRHLIDIASKGGNYLLNVGPTAEGRIPQPSVERLEAMGKWLSVNSEAIYATEASPFKQPSWGRYTQKPGKIYAHIFDTPAGNQLIIPEIKKMITRGYLLSDENRTSLNCELTAAGLVVSLPENELDAFATVVVLEYEGSLSDLLSR